jgi:hypothetical protein
MVGSKTEFGKLKNLVTGLFRTRNQKHCLINSEKSVFLFTPSISPIYTNHNKKAKLAKG